MPITLSERAAQELRNLMQNQEKENALLRVWVAGGGCSGLSYGMALDDNEPESDDQIYDCNGVRVVVDALSLKYMEGSTVDFLDDPMGGGFKIDNPNAVSSCGCGSSFRTAEGAAAGGGCGGCGCG